MEAFELYFNIITLIAGGYLLYTWFKLRQAGRLFPNQLLIPKDARPEHCLDEEGYIAYVRPRLFITGLLCTLVGVVCTLDYTMKISATHFSHIPDLQYWISQIGNLVCLASIIWYMVCWTKARKRYW